MKIFLQSTDKSSEMDYQESRRYSLETLFISLFCLLGAAVASYTLYLDLNMSSLGGQGVPMAKVERRESRVQRKHRGQFTWNNIQVDEDLFRKDFIQTGSGSAATVRFKDGSLLEIRENSLVVIDDVANLSLNFLRGTFAVQSASGVDQVVNVGKDGKAKIEEYPLHQIEPEPLSVYFVQAPAQKPVSFKWKTSGTQPTTGEYAIQISTSKNFKPELTQSIKPDAAGKTELSTQLNPGRYFWRIASQDKALTKTSQFRVIPSVALTPTWPNASEKVIAWEDDSSVQFRWASQGASKEALEDINHAQVEHQLEIARDKEFKTVAAKASVIPATGVVAMKSAPSGSLYWRIRSKYPDFTLVSPAEKFALEKAPKLVLETDKPDHEASLKSQPELRLTWRSNSSSVEFLAEIQNSAQKTVFNAKSRAMSAVWKAPAPGFYRWRVSAYSGEKKKGETAWRTFSIFTGGAIALKSPTKNQEILFWESPTQFNFQWTKDSEDQNFTYQLELAQDAQFQVKPAQHKTKATQLASAQTQLEPGTYFWRVRLVDAQGHVIKSSEASTFKYDHYPALQAPLATETKNGAVFNLMEKEEFPILTWDEVKDAQGYEVNLYPARSGDTRALASAEPVKKWETKTNTLEVKDLAAGDYTWTVRAIDRIKRRGPESSSKSFSITYGDTLDAPEIVSPEAQ